MRLRQRTIKTVYYRLYIGNDELIDEYGNKTGEFVPLYTDPVAIKVSVSPPSGMDVVELFGAIEHYDKIIQTCDMSCPIDENSVLYIDAEPKKTGTEWSAHDYIIKRVAPSVNTIHIAVSKVKVQNG